MKIPEIRKQLSQAANDLRSGRRPPEKVADAIDRLVPELWRKKPRQLAGRKVRSPMTPELKQRIRDFAKAHPRKDQQDIATEFNVNAGRVSEILSGHRK